MRNQPGGQVEIVSLAGGGEWVSGSGTMGVKMGGRD